MTPILIVDDNAVNRLALEALLRPLAVPFVLADGGASAVVAFERAEFSLVLIDLVMPVVDGFEAARRMRAHEFGSGRRTPIVAVTALDADAVRARCLAVGIDDVAGKPIDRAVIVAQIEKWTGEHVAGDRGAPEDVGKLVDTFLIVTRKLLAEIDVAIATHDEPRVRRAVHELRGAALQMNAPEIARLCRELDAAEHEDEMLAVYASLAHAFARVKSHETKMKSVWSTT